jgi:rhamnulose-1-phosphate aldolase
MSHNPEFLKKDVLTKLLGSMIPETLAFAPLGLGICPYGLPGSVLLADATMEQLRDYDVILWEKHGTCAVGTDIMDAFDQTDVLNKAATIYMSARNMGFVPEGMTEKDMQEIKDVFHLPTKRVL